MSAEAILRALPNLLRVSGFCIGALGAAGFSSPPETYAWALLLGGLAILGAGAVLGRAVRGGEAGDSGGGDGGRAEILAQIARIRDEVVELDEHKATLGAEELRRRIDELLIGNYFDLTSRHDEIAALLGFTDYAKVWEGVANAERMLARCWSLTTDGHYDVGVEELPFARANLVRAAEVMVAVTPSGVAP